MKKDPQVIVREITTLVNELALLAGTRVHVPKTGIPSTAKKKGDLDEQSGPTGGIRVLIQEGKLDEPQPLSEVCEFLREEGRHYSRPSVSMGLLNLVRVRVLRRLRDKDKKWKYVVRK
jgi:hypothetical protein